MPVNGLLLPATMKHMDRRVCLEHLSLTAIRSPKHKPNPSSLSLLPFLKFPVILALYTHHNRLLCRYVIVDNEC